MKTRPILAFLLSAGVLLIPATQQVIGPTPRLRVPVWDYSQGPINPTTGLPGGMYIFLTFAEMWPRLIEGASLPASNTILHRVTPILDTETPVIGSSCADQDANSIWLGRQGLFACAPNETGALAWAGTLFGFFTNPIEVGAALPNATVGIPYSQSLVANGGHAPYTWTILGGALPPGLSLSSTGIISGTATATGEYFVTVMVTDVLHVSTYATFSSTPQAAGG